MYYNMSTNATTERSNSTVKELSGATVMPLTREDLDHEKTRFELFKEKVWRLGWGRNEQGVKHEEKEGESHEYKFDDMQKNKHEDEHKNTSSESKDKAGMRKNGKQWNVLTTEEKQRQFTNDIIRQQQQTKEYEQISDLPQQHSSEEAKGTPKITMKNNDHHLPSSAVDSKPLDKPLTQTTSGHSIKSEEHVKTNSKHLDQLTSHHTHRPHWLDHKTTAGNDSLWKDSLSLLLIGLFSVAGVAFLVLLAVCRKMWLSSRGSQTPRYRPLRDYDEGALHFDPALTQSLLGPGRKTTLG